MTKDENSKRTDSEEKFLADSIKYLAKLEKIKKRRKQNDTASKLSSKIKKSRTKLKSSE